ncbi:hypothetical protein [Plectonema phage JingP1]|uniref:Uncharacterized protein n=1 Tax=Plectonema phage JingP1 TaxID=2961687 RepID=A0A9E7NLW3_9CAUD|nr:hypothetical protein [Plectonema phage JingP1]UVD33211.1 hypothetical protein [Plectonema phage Pbo-yong3]
MFPEGFKPESTRVSLRIALRRNPTAGVNRSPVLKGYVLVRLEQAKALVKLCEDSEDGSAFLDVGLWDDNTDTKFQLTGNVSVRNHDPNAELDADTAKRELPKSVWY